MRGCGNHRSVVLGDARITRTADPDARYDVLFVDALGSDSVPIHLITREALALYFATRAISWSSTSAQSLPKP